MKFASRFIILITLITNFANLGYAEEIRSTVSPGVIQITQNADKSFSFALCRGGENLDCSPIGNSPSYSLEELTFRYDTLHKQGEHTIEMDVAWVVGATTIAAIVMFAQAIPPAGAAVDGAVVAAVDTDAAVTATAVASATVATGAETTGSIAEEETAAEQAKTAQAVAKAVAKVKPKFNGPLATSGMALASSLASLAHSWFEPGSTSSPMYKFTIAKTVSTAKVEGATILTVKIPIEDYAQELSTALNSEY